jgi:hypothetical protein
VVTLTYRRSAGLKKDKAPRGSDAVTPASCFQRLFSDETDPSKLYDLAAALDGREVYDQAQGTNSALFLHVARPD